MAGGCSPSFHLKAAHPLSSRCNTGYVGVQLKGCYSACPAAYPVAVNTGVTRPVCAQRCPTAAPYAVNGQPAKCTDNKGNYVVGA